MAGWFHRAPFRGLRLATRLLRELQGIRRALERQADVLELAASGGSLGRPGTAQAFRGSWRRSAGQASDDGSSVSYVDDAGLAEMLAVQGQVEKILGRPANEAELERAFREAGINE